MKVYYDLHIHSTLSACGSSLQTPNNILNMCMLKGLDLISITDHNTLKHLRTFSKIINSYNFLFLFGVEVTVKEGFHVLAYFETLDKALIFDEIIDKCNPKNPHDISQGQQIIFNEFDEEVEEIKYKLNTPLNISLEEMIYEVHKLDGVVVLAHIDRTSGILDYYPDFSRFKVDGIEIKYIEKINDLFNKYPYLLNYKYLVSSDAHNLDIINEPKYYLELTELTFESFKKAMHE